MMISRAGNTCHYSKLVAWYLYRNILEVIDFRPLYDDISAVRHTRLI